MLFIVESIPTPFLNSYFFVILVCLLLCYTIVYRAIARLNKLIGHKLYIVRGDCFNIVFDCSVRIHRLAKVGKAGALPRPNLATSLHCILV